MIKQLKFYNQILFLVLIIIFIFTAYALATIRVEPSRIILNALEKERSTGVIEVINNGEEEVELTTLLKDWSLDEKDSVVVFEAVSYTHLTLPTIYSV